MLCKKYLVFFLLLLVSFLQADEKIILKVFELPDPKATDAFSRADRAVIAAFKEKYPNIELRSFSGIKIENMDLDAGPLMAIAGGVSPDVIYVNFRQSATYIEKGFLYPLDEYVNSMEEEELQNRIYEPVWPVVKRQKEKKIRRTYLDAALRNTGTGLDVSQRFVPARGS